MCAPAIINERCLPRASLCITDTPSISPHYSSSPPCLLRFICNKTKTEHQRVRGIKWQFPRVCFTLFPSPFRGIACPWRVPLPCIKANEPSRAKSIISTWRMLRMPWLLSVINARVRVIRDALLRFGASWRRHKTTPACKKSVITSLAQRAALSLQPLRWNTAFHSLKESQPCRRERERKRERMPATWVDLFFFSFFCPFFAT